MIEQKQHSSWGPSSSHRRILCPGSLAAEALHKDTDNIHAVIGSGAHALGEAVLRQYDVYEVSLEAEDWIGEQMFVPMSDDLIEPLEFDNDQVESYVEIAPDPKSGYLVTVDSEMAHHVNDYVTFVKQRVMHKNFHGVNDIEEEVDLSTWLPGNKGTADSIVLVGKTLHVTDLKYGKGVKVFAKGNTQGRCYALGAYDKYKHVYDIKKIAINIHQPRLGHVDTEVLTIDELLSWAESTLVPAYIASLRDDAQRIPGTKQCQFCKHKAICPELRDEVDFAVKDSFPILDKHSKLETSVIPLQLAELATTWAKAVEAFAFEQLEAGEQVIDEAGEEYKLVHGRGSRTFNDPVAAQKRLRMNKIFSKDFLTTPAFKSVAQIEKLIGAKAFNTGFSDLVDKKEGKPTLAPMSDKRKAISSAEALGFEDVS